MHTGTHTLCHHAHRYSHIVQSCTPVLTHCAIMHTSTHTLCNHAHLYSQTVQSCTPVLTHCAIMHTGTHKLYNHAHRYSYIVQSCNAIAHRYPHCTILAFYFKHRIFNLSSYCTLSSTVCTHNN